ncbi:MAG: glycoside hydrolase family 127 protein [Dorea sp.]|nr:glycoside hydrolase family 127 protein [Dorea sp.]
MSYTNEEIVKLDAESIYLGNLNTVEFDLTLPVRGQLGSTITWQSGHERFLSNTGKVQRPKYGMNDRKITLDATVTYEDASYTRRFLVKVLQLPNTLKVKSVESVEAEGSVGEEIELPAAAIVTRADGIVISHSVDWEEETVLFKEAGTYHRKGFLKDTEIPVEAVISVLQTKERPTDRRPNAMIEPSRVIFEAGPFADSQERMHQHLLSLDNDQLLYNHRLAAGLDTKGAPPMEGWDSPESNLRGHTTGHYLSALALCYRTTKDERILAKAIDMVESLKDCQNSFEENALAQAGYLAGYPENQFDLLEAFMPYPEIWAPYYTMHKLMAGLLDLYQYAGIEDAFTIAARLGDWVYHRLSRLPKKQLTRMWSMYIAGEFGGMNEAMARLYGLTGNPDHLACARLFDNDKLFYPLSKYTDALTGMHANQHIPQIIGAVELYKATGEDKYLRIAKTFWRSTVSSHIYVNGGVGEGEMFHDPDQIGALLTAHTTESCASYNMLKLTKELYKLAPDREYLDYYERTTFNHILANQEEKGSGNTTYFFPLAPGQKRLFEEENHCCHGTGLESPFRYQDGIANLKEWEEGSYTLLVNYYTPCTIEFEDQKIHVEIKDEAPEDCGKFFLHVIAEGEKLRNVRVRPPYWAQMGDNDSGRKKLEDGRMHHEVWAEFTYSFRIEHPSDRPDLGVICYGPYVLAILDDQQEFLTLDLTEELLNQKARVLSMEEFEYDGMKMCPLYLVGDRAYHTYFFLR